MIDARFVADFRARVEEAAAVLLELDAGEAARRPGPGKWSRKEIIGHLVDSAANNHTRFVRAQIEEDMIFLGYEQDAWVRVERYHDADWIALVELWRAYNHHIAHIMASADAEALDRPRSRHNLDNLAWQAIPATESATLDYFMRDYVDHMNHHLRQVFFGFSEQPAPRP
jgi:hypothetical protein